MCVTMPLEGAAGPAWFDYWHALGIDRFYVYLNHDLDDLTPTQRGRLVDLLAHTHRVVTLVEWPYRHTDLRPGSRMHYGQMMAFQSCWHRYRGLHTHMAFFDVDEFLVLPADASLPHFLARGGRNATTRFQSVRFGHYMAAFQAPDGRDLAQLPPGASITRDAMLSRRTRRHRDFDAPWDRKKIVVATPPESGVVIVGNHWVASDEGAKRGAVEVAVNASDGHFLHWVNLAPHVTMSGPLLYSMGASADIAPVEFEAALRAARDANSYYGGGGDGG